MMSQCPQPVLCCPSSFKSKLEEFVKFTILFMFLLQDLKNRVVSIGRDSLPMVVSIDLTTVAYVAQVNVQSTVKQNDFMEGFVI